MSQRLFDPYSARYRFYEPVKGYAYVLGTINPPELGYIVLVSINAKNRMGAYTGEKGYVFLFQGENFYEEDLGRYGILSLPVEQAQAQIQAERGAGTESESGAGVQEQEDKKDAQPEETTSSESVSGDGFLVLELSGSGVTETRPFTVDGEWEVRWQAEASFFQIYAYRITPKSDSPMDKLRSMTPHVLANTTTGGSGSSYVSTGGKFRFTINALGPWSLKVVRIDTSK